MRNIDSKEQTKTYYEPNDSTQLVLHAEAVPHGFIPKFIRTIRRLTRYEQQFDTCYPEPERLAVLNLSIDGKDNELVVVPRPFVDAAIQETTGIECGTLLSMQFGSNLVYTDPHYPKYIKENVAAVYPDFAKTIGMTFVEGNDEGLDTPNGAIISAEAP